MIRWAILAFFISSSAYSISLSRPKLYFNVGANYISVASNRPTYLVDFGALNIGSTLEYPINTESSLNIHIDAAYTPNRRNITLKNEGEVIKGDSDLLTSVYSLNYAHMFSKTDHDEWRAQAGPAMGLYTVDFYTFKKNETEIDRINRIRVRNFGARFSLKRTNDDQNDFFELAYFYLIQNKLTVIDDSSLDADAVYKNKSIENDITWGLFLNYGWKLY